MKPCHKYRKTKFHGLNASHICRNQGSFVCVLLLLPLALAEEMAARTPLCPKASQPTGNAASPTSETVLQREHSSILFDNN